MLSRFAFSHIAQLISNYLSQGYLPRLSAKEPLFFTFIRIKSCMKILRFHRIFHMINLLLYHALDAEISYCFIKEKIGSRSFICCKMSFKRAWYILKSLACPRPVKWKKNGNERFLLSSTECLKCNHATWNLKMSIFCIFSTK